MSREERAPPDEVDDHGFKVVGRSELRRPHIGLDLPVREGGHGDPSSAPGVLTSTEQCAIPGEYVQDCPYVLGGVVGVGRDPEVVVA